MSSNKRDTKIYGAIETDSHITFKGFCKKIYSNEQQKVNVFIDGQKIDTIEANKNIEEIEDKYEVFATDGFCFEYEVHPQYIGGKHNIEFISEDNNQLLNSPNFTADKNSSRYNEYIFFNSLLTLKNSKELKNLYTKNAIGFLALDENILDNAFNNYIFELNDLFPKINFKIFYFTQNEKNNANRLFGNKLNNVSFIKIINILTISKEIEIYTLNFAAYKSKSAWIYYLLYNYSNKIFLTHFIEKSKKMYLKDFSKELYVSDSIIDTKLYFDFKNFKILPNLVEDKKIEIDKNITISEFKNLTLELILKYSQLKEYLISQNTDLRKVNG